MSLETSGTAVVTGASTGIGAVYADRLARRGHDLVLVARDTARLDALAVRLRAETGRMVDVLTADLATTEGVARVEARIAADPKIAMLVNNAGMSHDKDLLDGAPGAFDQVIALNITAPTRLAAAAAQAFAARGAGTIINISSVLAVAPELSGSVYSGSKAYVLNLSIKLAAMARDKGVRVQVVLPGATRTEIWQRAGRDIDTMLPADKVMDVNDLVDAALVGLDQGELVTIPPLADAGQWEAFEQARVSMLPKLSNRAVAPRYR